MSIYKELTPILNYIHQIRKVETFLIFDILFPNTWKIPKKFIIEDKFVNQGTSEDNLILLWFVSEINESEIEKTKNNIVGIINYNLEREEKEKLFENKISELKNIFEKQSLDSLKNLKFDIKNSKENLFDNGKSKDNEVVSGIIEEG
jgi:hypothetical protein